MGNVVKLSVHKNTLEKRKRLECNRRLKSLIKTAPKDLDGWALFCFHKTNNGLIVPYTHYHCVDAKDSASLPDLVKMELIRGYISPDGHE